MKNEYDDMVEVGDGDRRLPTATRTRKCMASRQAARKMEAEIHDPPGLWQPSDHLMEKRAGSSRSATAAARSILSSSPG